LIKIDITNIGTGTRFLDDDGNEIKSILAKSIKIDVGVDKATTANVTIALFSSAMVDVGDLKYTYGEYQNVVGLLLDNGSKIMLPNKKTKALSND